MISRVLRRMFPGGSDVTWTDAMGTWDGWRLPDGYTPLPALAVALPTPLTGYAIREACTNYIPPTAELAQRALSDHAKETAELAGIQLNADPVKRAKARPIEECRSLQSSPGAVATHLLETTIEGVRVKLLAIATDED